MNATEMSTEELLMDRLVRAYVKKYKLIKLVFGVDTLLNEKEQYWKNPRDENMWYSYSEIVEFIGLMNNSEIICTLKGRNPSNYKD
jgi:hypothetical protein